MMEKKIDNMSNKKFSDWDKYVYTMILCLNQMSFGLSSSSFGPAFVDLKFILNTPMDWISLIATFNAIGYITGSLCGFLYKYVDRQIASIVQLIAISITTALVPYSQHLWSLYLCIWIYGLGCGAWNNVMNVWLIEIWQQKSAPVLQLSQFMFGIGTIFGPLIDKPYLTGQKQHNLEETYISNSTLLQTNSSTLMIDEIQRRSKLKIPFLIIGIIQMIGPILMTAMFVIKKYKLSPQKQSENSDICAVKLFDAKWSPRLVFIILSSMLLAFSCSSEGIYLQFSATYYQYIPLKLTAIKSAEIVSAMALSYTIARGLSIFIAIKIKPQYMIAYHFLILFIAIAILFFGQNSITLIWIGSLVLSYGFSSVFPSQLSFIAQYIGISNKIGAILIFSSASLNTVTPFIIGPYIENSSTIFLFSMVTISLISLLLFAVILVFIRETKKNDLNFINNNISQNEL